MSQNDHDARYATKIMKSTVGDFLASARQVAEDADRVARFKSRQCVACYYVRRVCAGQSFTGWICQECDVVGEHPDTAVPKLCNACSDKRKRCVRCMASIRWCPADEASR